jgi:hypothetical protein
MKPDAQLRKDIEDELCLRTEFPLVDRWQPNMRGIFLEG